MLLVGSHFGKPFDYLLKSKTLSQVPNYHPSYL
jgi:hypothetical protein